MNELTDINMDDAHIEKGTQLAQADALDKMFRAIEIPQPKPDIEAKPGTEMEAPAKPEETDKGRTAAADVGMGIIESPSQVVGGIIDAGNEVSDMFAEFGDWLNDNVMDLGHIAMVDGELGHLSGEELDAMGGEINNALQLPTTPEADSVTGNFVRNIAQFMAGFAGFGKVQHLQKLRNLGTGGRITSDAIRGALSDFAVFDPHEERLSDLIQSIPSLANPVTEFLQADEDDTAIEGRLKQSVEGIIPGVAVDLATEGLVKGLRAIKSVHKARGAVEQLDEVKQLEQVTTVQRERVTELLGDPDAPVWDIKPVEVDPADLQKGGKGATPEAQDIFINWARIDSPDDVKGIIQEMANLSASDINKARRGVVGWKQTILDAEHEDAFKILAERSQGQPLNNAQTVAVRELWARSGSKLKELTDAVVSDPSDMNKIAFRKMLAVHNSIQEQVISARTETARALNAWKIPAGDNIAFSGQMEQLQGLMQDGRTTEAIAQSLKKLSDAGMAKEADAFVYGTPWMKTADAVAQWWYFSLLSGPKTHMRNILGNTARMFKEVGDRKVASLIGQVKGAENVPSGETSAMLFGMLQGFKDAFKVSAKGRQVLMESAKQRSLAPIKEGAEEFGTFYRSMATGESGYGIGKVDLPRMGALSSEKLGLDKQTLPGRVMDFIDTSTTMPGRFLGAADEVFKSMNFRMEMNAQAFRQATQELDAGKIVDFDARVHELLNDPDEAMQLMSRRSAQVNTFTDDPQNTPVWEAFKKIGGVPVLGRIALPFRRTIYNIGLYTFENTPMAPMVKRWRDEVAAGGARADVAWARFLTGNAILLTMADLAMNGDVTGEGPANHRQREALRRSGVASSSVRVQTGTDSEGDPLYRYFSYRGLEPISSPLGIASNVVEILQHTDWDDENAEIDELVIASTMAIANQLTSAQYMTGMSEFFNAMSDPQRYGERWWQRLAGSVSVPAIVKEKTFADDPYLREVNNMIDAVKARTPGLSKELPFKRDAWGQKISRESGLGDMYDAISPIYSRSKEAQPIDKELQRLELWIGKPPKRTSFEGVTVAMDRYPKAYDRWTELQGQEITETVLGAPISAGGFVSSGEPLMKELNMLARGKHPNYPDDLYQRLSDSNDGGKAGLIRQIISAYRNAAKEYLVEEFPDLKAEIDSRKERQQGKYIFQ